MKAAAPEATTPGRINTYSKISLPAVRGLEAGVHRIFGDFYGSSVSVTDACPFLPTPNQLRIWGAFLFELVNSLPKIVSNPGYVILQAHAPLQYCPHHPVVHLPGFHK
jgi:hypothetical protein